MAFPVRKIRTAGTVRPSTMGAKSDLFVSNTGDNPSRNYNSNSKIVRSKSARSYFTSPRPSSGRYYESISTLEDGYHMAYLRASHTRVPGDLHGRQVSTAPRQRLPRGTQLGGVDQRSGLPRGLTHGRRASSLGFPTPSKHRSGQEFVNLRQEITSRVNETILPRPHTAANGRPQTAANGRSQTAANGQPQTAVNGRPQTAANRRPQTAVNGRPQTAVNGRPQTAANGRPRTAVNGRPQTAANGRYFHYYNGLCKLDSSRAPVVYGPVDDPKYRVNPWQGPSLRIHKIALVPKVIQCY